ncbi:MAG: guanine deaminase [Phenylobacterium sp.]|uniref:guanine deaminase n=1 Tax=Phenylobacterium sp. TaxID=1871053 RepID=UPI001A5D8FBA|nr:guanine deaminase [Phenylobacterium sp.]MBL8772418.1 guanine deaminase [Phenylobacterium sp.]
MASVSGLQGVRGAFVHAPLLGEVDFHPDALIAFDETGQIRHVDDARAEDSIQLASRLAEAGSLLTLDEGQVLLPGLIDLHVHAPQFPQMGTCLDLPLEDWLMKYTFPLEARYSDIAFAQHVYDLLVRELLAQGTTTAVYFATIHQDASLALARRCMELGQRAFVGKLSMDNPETCPDFYREAGASAGIASARAFIHAVGELTAASNGLVKPVITPRFLPSCTDDLLSGLGELTGVHGCHVQTHCSESDWEHGYGLQRFGATDTLTLERFGLLTDRTILAHCNFIDDEDIGRIRSVGAGVAHCPLSNIYFSHAVFASRRALEAGVDVGLGSDIAGGSSPSLIENMRMAIHVSRLLEDGVDHRLAKAERGREGARISSREAFWMATTAGGRALSEPIGLFREGYRFDAILMDARRPVFPGMPAGERGQGIELIDRLVYASHAQNIRKVWVDGRIVVDKGLAATAR